MLSKAVSNHSQSVALKGSNSYGHHTLGNIVAGNSWWPQCCAQIHQQLCCPFTDNNDVSYSTWSSKNVTQLVACLCKIAYRYACIVLKESMWLCLCHRHCHRATYEGGEEGDAINVCVADHGCLTARGKEHLITSCRRYACVIHMI